MIEDFGFWGRYFLVMAVLIFTARAFWLAARDEREARQWSDVRECLATLKRMEHKP